MVGEEVLCSEVGLLSREVCRGRPEQRCRGRKRAGCWRTSERTGLAQGGRYKGKELSAGVGYRGRQRRRGFTVKGVSVNVGETRFKQHFWRPF